MESYPTITTSTSQHASIHTTKICTLPLNPSRRRPPHQQLLSFTTPPILSELTDHLTNLTTLLLRPLPLDGLNLPEHMGAGFLATALAVAAMHPLDSIKTQLQSGAKGFSNAISTLTRNGKGPFGLYRGLGYSVLGQAPAGAVKFAVFESLKQRKDKWPWVQKLGYFGEFLFGAIAFTCASVFLVPGDVVKVRSQAGVQGGMRMLWRKEGLGGFYRGYKMTLIRDVPYTMFEFGLYSTFKTILGKIVGRKLSATEEFSMGGLAGGCTGFLTTPLDVVRTNIMAGKGNGEKVRIWRMLKEVARKEGLPGLFKGSSARVAWLIPFTAIFFGVHEASKRALKNGKQIAPVSADRKLRKL